MNQRLLPAKFLRRTCGLVAQIETLTLLRQFPLENQDSYQSAR